MNMTIRNKLIWGFAAVLGLMASIAAIGGYAVATLKQGAYEATRIGGQLNALSLEIQVHNLEAHRRVMSFLQRIRAAAGSDAAASAGSGDNLIEEAQFEIHEIRALVKKAIRIAPSTPERVKFEKIATALNAYEAAMQQVVSISESKKTGELARTVAAYDTAAERLHEDAEDGEAAGRAASQTSLEQIDNISSSSVTLVTVISIAGLILGIALSVTLGRAILIPVEHLKDVAESVSLGNLNIAVRRYSDDEIGDLADSFGRMVTAVKFFRMEAEAVEGERS